MTARTQSAIRIDAEILAIASAVFLGLGVIFVTGFANAAALHDATHDTRHAVVAPCH